MLYFDPLYPFRKINKIGSTLSDQDVAVEKRFEALNHFHQLLTKYAGTGQDIFYETNEAKYNDYIIYDTPSGLPEVPPTEVV